MLRFVGWKRAFRRFKKSRRGSAAVEFALVLFPFFLLTAGMAEIAMIGFAQTSLDFAVSETARQIRTGRAQMGGVSYTQIQQQLCTNMSSFMAVSCGGNLYLDVDRFTSFVAAGAPQNPVAGGTFTPNFGYTPGGPSSIVVVRAYYRWRIMTPFFEQFFANAGHDRVMVSTMMFRNEPFCTPGANGCPPT